MGTNKEVYVKHIKLKGISESTIEGSGPVVRICMVFKTTY